MIQLEQQLIPIEDINRVLTDREFIDSEYPELREAYYDTQLVQEGIMPRTIGELVERVLQNRSRLTTPDLITQIEELGINSAYVMELLNEEITVGAIEQPCPITQNIADLGQFGSPKDLEDFIRTPQEIAANLRAIGLPATAGFITFGSYQIGRGISDHSYFSVPGRGAKYTTTQNLSLIPRPRDKQGYDSVKTSKTHVDKVMQEGERLKKTIYDNTRKNAVRKAFMADVMDCREWTPEQYAVGIEMLMEDIQDTWEQIEGDSEEVSYVDFITVWNEIFTRRFMNGNSFPTLQPRSVEAFGTYGLSDPRAFFTALVEAGAYDDQGTNGLEGIKPVRIAVSYGDFSRWINMQVVSTKTDDLILSDPGNPDFQVSFKEAQAYSKQVIASGGSPTLVLGKQASYFLESSGLLPQLLNGDDGVIIPAFQNSMNILASGRLLSGLSPMIWPYSAKTMVAADVFEKAKAQGEIDIKTDQNGNTLGDYYDYLDTHAIEISDGTVRMLPYQSGKRNVYCTLDYYAEIAAQNGNM